MDPLYKFAVLGLFGMVAVQSFLLGQLFGIVKRMLQREKTRKPKCFYGSGERECIGANVCPESTTACFEREDPS
jgi:hypothetical protein